MPKSFDLESTDAREIGRQAPALASPVMVSRSRGVASGFDDALLAFGSMAARFAHARALCAEAKALKEQAVSLRARFLAVTSAAPDASSSELGALGDLLNDVGGFLRALEAHCRVSTTNDAANELASAGLTMLNEIDELLDLIATGELDGARSARPPSLRPYPDARGDLRRGGRPGSRLISERAPGRLLRRAGPKQG